MKDTIDKIYKSLITDADKYGVKNESISALRKEYFEIGKKINLNDEQRELVYKREEILTEISQELHKEGFTKGFELGIRLVLESLK